MKPIWNEKKGEPIPKVYGETWDVRGSGTGNFFCTLRNRSFAQALEYVANRWPRIFPSLKVVRNDGTEWWDVRQNRDDGTPGIWLGLVEGNEKQAVEKARAKWSYAIGKMTLTQRKGYIP